MARKPKNESARIRARLRDHERRQVSLSLTSVLYMTYGAGLLLALSIAVLIWSGEPAGYYAIVLGKLGYPPVLGGAVFFLWIVVAILHMAAGRELQEKSLRGRWLASIASVWMLSSGLFRIANGIAGFIDSLVFVGLPLLGLFVVNVVAVDYLKPTAESE